MTHLGIFYHFLFVSIYSPKVLKENIGCRCYDLFFLDIGSAPLDSFQTLEIVYSL